MARPHFRPPRRWRSRGTHASGLRRPAARTGRRCRQRYSRYRACPYCAGLQIARAGRRGLGTGGRRRLLACRTEAAPRTAYALCRRAVVDEPSACRDTGELARPGRRAGIDLERCRCRYGLYARERPRRTVAAMLRLGPRPEASKAGVASLVRSPVQGCFSHCHTSVREAKPLSSPRGGRDGIWAAAK